MVDKMTKHLLEETRGKLEEQRKLDSRVLNHLLNKMNAIEPPGPDDTTSPIYNALVNRIKVRLEKNKIRCKNKKEMDTLARKMAAWVERTMNTALSKSIDSAESTDDNEEIRTDEDAEGEETEHKTSWRQERFILKEDEDIFQDCLENVENFMVEKTSPLKMTTRKSGEVYRMKGKDGRDIEVSRVLLDDKERAIVRQKRVASSEWSSWMLEVNDHTERKSEETKQKTSSSPKFTKGSPRDIDRFLAQKKLEKAARRKVVDGIQSKDSTTPSQPQGVSYDGDSGMSRDTPRVRSHNKSTN